MADAADLRQGSIIWITHIPDPQGRNPKSQARPFVIVSATNDIRPGSAIIAVAVTSTFKEPVTDRAMVPMRWNDKGTAETGFRRKCFAKLDWTVAVQIRQSETGAEFAGDFHGTYVRSRELELILLAINRMADRA